MLTCNNLLAQVLTHSYCSLLPVKNMHSEASCPNAEWCEGVIRSYKVIEPMEDGLIPVVCLHVLTTVNGGDVDVII